MININNYLVFIIRKYGFVVLNAPSNSETTMNENIFKLKNLRLTTLKCSFEVLLLNRFSLGCCF